MPDLFCEALIRHNEELEEHGGYLKLLEDEIKKKGLERNFAETVLGDIPIGTIACSNNHDRFLLMYYGGGWAPIDAVRKIREI